MVRKRFAERKELIEEQQRGVTFKFETLSSHSMWLCIPLNLLKA